MICYCKWDITYWSDRRKYTTSPALTFWREDYILPVFETQEKAPERKYRTYIKFPAHLWDTSKGHEIQCILQRIFFFECGLLVCFQTGCSFAGVAEKILESKNCSLPWDCIEKCPRKFFINGKLAWEKGKVVPIVWHVNIRVHILAFFLLLLYPSLKKALCVVI